MLHVTRSRPYQHINKYRTNLCSTCGGPRDTATRNTCRRCHAAYMRANRPRWSELSDEQRLKSNCRSYAHVYLKRGKLKQEPCAKCGAPNSEMHHPDYTKPLEIVWLCRPHHLEEEKNRATTRS